MIYQPGQRVALVHTSDPYTRLRPGDTGTVRRHDQRRNIVEVTWDSGSTLSMCLDDGDRIEPAIPTPPPRGGLAGDAAGWAAALERMSAAGTEAGRAAAEWWAQDTIGGRVSGDTRLAARRILAGIDDGDPAVLDTLPQVFSAGGPFYTAAWELFADATGDVSGWFGLRIQQREEAMTVYRDAFDTAATDRVAELCHLAASPTGRDVSHLHPDRVRIGGAGVFSGEWALTVGPDGNDRIEVGFVGTLIDHWDGWAVFSCTRPVAEAIVADQQRHRDEYRNSLRELGVPADDLDRRVDAELADLSFDGDVIVADQRALSDDPQAIERLAPDGDGRYVVMGRSWRWEAVDPYACDRIVGDLPAPGTQQRFVELPHTGMRVPHDRLRVTDVQAVPGTPPTSLITLALDEASVAEALSGADGSCLSRLSAAFGRNDWAAYLSGCRQHGQPTSETQVLDALITEFQVGQAARQAAADGAVLTRLLDADGTILRLRPVWPAPRGHSARRQLGKWLRREDPHPQGQLWQWWTGTAWQHLASITGLHTATDPSSRQPDLGQLLAFVIAESLYERVDRDELIEEATDNGIPLDRQMSDDQIRTLLRAALRERGRERGLPVDDLPTLSAAEGLELGRIAAGGAPTTDQPAPHDPDQPLTH
ncbi:DUF4314 domain-containing protein [Micromonospora craterilacus]|uniref:DUF4314 domain-containing protein n=1 Tax=Micromonospora craterilacus TaxID=1655439 RepID=UPI001F46B386|nr:DUF4314 domain-containing protein [Micromonospora craterilacus]